MKFYHLLFIFFLSTTVFGQKTINTLNHGYYAHGTLSPNDYSVWKYYIPNGDVGVFTLKNTASTSDLDIHIDSDQGLNYKLDAGTNNRTKTELVTLSTSYSGRYVYLKIKNEGRYVTKFKLNAHQIDLFELGQNAVLDAAGQYVIEEGLKWLFGVEDNSSQIDSRNIQRASNVILSGLKGQNLGSTTKSLVKQELTTELRDQFGYGFVGNFCVSYSVDVLDEVYKYYW